MRRGPQVRGFLVATCRVWFAGNLSRKPLSVNRMMKTFRILAAALLGSALALPANAAEGVEVLHEEALENGLFGRNEVAWHGQSGQAGPRSVTFDALGRRFALELESNERLITRALSGRVPDGVGVYRGRLEGQPDSWVRLVVADGVPTGLIWDGEEMLAVEARSNGSGASTAVIYRLQDVYVEPGTMTCGNAGHVASFATVYEGLEGELRNIIVQAPGAVEELNVGVIADFELTQAMGAATETEILARINNVDGIYSEQLGVQITASEIETFTSADDPFTATVPEELLVEVAEYRRNTPAQAAQGITFLFTGREFAGTTTVGVAYREAVCSPRFGAGLGQARRGVATDSLIAAHEIGHLFGAQHDGEDGSPCAAVTGSFLMSPRVSNTDVLSSCSIDTMRPFIDSAYCINALPEADVALALAGGAPDLLLGDSAALEFDVINNGTLDATNVTASFDIPANLALGLVSSTAGTCSSGAGQVDCTLGTIAGMATERIGIAVTADAVGVSSVSGSVAADADLDAGNNSLVVPVSVSPATDLLVGGVANVSITVDDAVSIQPTVENVSSLDATDVALSISFSAGLRVDSASWPGGACTVSAAAVDCQRASLAAQSQAAVDIRVTALAAGSQSYSATVVSSEVDRDQSNNSGTGTVTVSAIGGNGNDSDSGGGAVNLIWLLLLAVGGLRRRHLPR